MGNQCYSEVKIKNEPNKSLKMDFSNTITQTTMESKVNSLIPEFDQIKEQQQRKNLFYQESTILQMPPIQYVRHDFKSSCNEQSHLKSMIATCFQCQMDIENITIQLQCHHMYHEECFIEYLKNQLTQKQTTLQCICNYKISSKTLKLFKIPEKYFERLLKLQMIELANKYKLIQCEKCKFIYYNQDNTECNCLNN